MSGEETNRLIIFLRSSGQNAFQFSWVQNDEASFNQILKQKITPVSVHKGKVAALRPVVRNAASIPFATFMSTPPNEGMTYEVIFESQLMSLQELLAVVAAKKEELDHKRPLNAKTLALLYADDDTVMTCHSTGLEGNSYELSETRYLLEKGLTVDNKPIKDVFEIYDHREAMQFVRSLGETKIDDKVMLSVHKKVLQRSKPDDAGIYRNSPIYVTGTSFEFPLPAEVEEKMAGFYSWLREEHSEHPVLFAVEAHLRFVTVHPFADGNGRTSRLLCNMILMQAGYPPCCPSRGTRDAYMDAVRRAQLGGSSEGLVRIFAECAMESLNRYLQTASLSSESKTAS